MMERLEVLNKAIQIAHESIDSVAALSDESFERLSKDFDDPLPSLKKLILIAEELYCEEHKRHLSDKSSVQDTRCVCPEHGCKLTPIEICEQCMEVVSRR